MNLASALIKQVLVLQDSETWSQLRPAYLPEEYRKLYSVIEGEYSKNHSLPTIESLTYSIRDAATRDKLLAINAVEVDVDAHLLLEYLKNEYVQSETFSMLEEYIDKSIAFEDARETVDHLHQIVMTLEEKVDLEDPQESMQRISLFEAPEELSKYLALGLNSDYDSNFKFTPRDLILVGGKRGAGKSIACCNVANAMFESGKTAVYFTIEMDSRSILQRMCAIGTGISHNKIRSMNLSVTEWEKVAQWWAARFEGGQDVFSNYLQHRSFTKFHDELRGSCSLDPKRQLDVVYDASLSLARIRSELDKKMKSSLDVGVIIVDYINQVRKRADNFGSQYEWQDQIEISKTLKSIAQEYNVPVFSPYQIDASGEARFAKGILDAADAAFVLHPYNDDSCITFECVKMRSANMTSFTSYMDWASLKIGPDSAEVPVKGSNKSKEEIHDL